MLPLRHFLNVPIYVKGIKRESGTEPVGQSQESGTAGGSPTWDGSSSGS